MKRYKVVFSAQARQEALKAAEYIAESSPHAAVDWYKGLKEAVESLRVMPARCSFARESVTLAIDLRHYIYHSHRIIFRIEEKPRIVRILHVRHSAQRTVGEIDETTEDDG